MSEKHAADGKKVKKKKSLPVLIIDVIVVAVFLFAAGCLLTVTIQTATGKDPSLFGYRTMVILTDSMTGTYDRGDVIIVKELSDGQRETPGEAIAAGDVITFVAPEGFGAVEGYNVTHRAVEDPYIGEDGRWYVVTRGDASASRDPVPVPVDDIVGKVVGSSAFLAGLQSFFGHWYGYAIIVVIPLLGILIWQIVWFAKESGRAKREKLARYESEEKEKLDRQLREREEELKRIAVEEYEKTHGKDGEKQ